MSKLTLPTISTEAINYQGRSLLFFDLVAIVEQLRAAPNASHNFELNPYITQAALDKAGLETVVFNRTGMRVLFFVEDFAELSCYAEPPVVDSNHPYYKHLDSYDLMDTKKTLVDRHQRAVRLAHESMGWVDLKTGRVSGLFSKMTNRIMISARLVTDPSFSSEEVAAVVLHELGHIFSFFETMAYTTASNMVLVTASEALAGMSDKREKVRLLTDSIDPFGKLDPELADAVLESTDKAVIHSIMLKSVEQLERDRVKDLIAKKNDDAYTTRSLEFMADQFAIRHGAGLHLAKAEHKMAKTQRADYGRSKAGYMAVQAARISLLGLSAAFVSVPITAVLGVMVAIVQSANAINDDYVADPGERMGRIKADLVQLLKNQKLSTTMRKQLLHDIEAVDALRATAKEHDGIFRYLWRNVAPSGRRQFKIREFQKGLEDLVNNNLFVHAASMRQ